MPEKTADPPKSESKEEPLNWAAAVEDADGEDQGDHLPPRQETTKDGIKRVIEYKFNENDEKVKTVSEYKIETKRVPKQVAVRKRLKKFGDSSNDPPGPSPSTTYLSDAIDAQFVRNRAGELVELKQDDNLMKLKADPVRQACKYCKAPDHMSFACPYKAMYEESRSLLEGETTEVAPSREQEVADKIKDGKYVPPSMRSGGTGRPSPGSTMDRRDDFTVRVTNLPEDTTDNDLRDLFKEAGHVQRIFLAKDKSTNKSKGFAFVTYLNREDAEKAIKVISGHRYDHLILKVEWARPNVN